MEKVTFCTLKTSLSSNFVHNLQLAFRGLGQVYFYDFVNSALIPFYLSVNTDKPKFVAFLVFVCMTALLIAQISSSENISKRDAILTPVAKQ